MNTIIVTTAGLGPGSQCLKPAIAGVNKLPDGTYQAIYRTPGLRRTERIDWFGYGRTRALAIKDAKRLAAEA